MRISDWSSDVCSSDLLRIREAGGPHELERRARRRRLFVGIGDGEHRRHRTGHPKLVEIGIADELYRVPRRPARREVADRVTANVEAIGHDLADVRHAVLQRAERAKDRKSTRLNSSHYCASRMPSSACKKNKQPPRPHTSHK